MSLLSPQLQAFVAVVQHQSVHAAARSIGITQTGVTQRIRSLESQLSSTLFIRSRKGMRPTPEGEALYRYCRGALDLEGQALPQIVGAARESLVEVSIIGPTSIMSSRVVPGCAPVLKRFPQLLFRFQISDLESRVEDLRRGAVQLALLAPEQVAREMDSKLLKPEKFLMVGPRKWKGRKTDEIVRSERMIDFDPSDQASFSYLRAFGLLPSARTDRHFVNHNEALIHLFRAEAGYGVLTIDVAKPWLDRGELVALNGGKIFESPVALAWYPRPEMPEYLDCIIRSIR